MPDRQNAAAALRRDSMKPRLKEVTPFSRYNREEIALLRMLLAEHRTCLDGNSIAYKQCCRLLAKLEDDLKMRP